MTRLLDWLDRNADIWQPALITVSFALLIVAIWIPHRAPDGETRALPPSPPIASLSSKVQPP